MRYRYWLKMRPAMPGTIPTENLICIHNFDSRTYEEEAGREVWGFVEYSTKLPNDKVDGYELIEGKGGYMTWDEICGNADGAIFGDPFLRVKDNARANIRELIIKCKGVDIEDDDCPEAAIEIYCDEMNIEFDCNGMVVNMG